MSDRTVGILFLGGLGGGSLLYFLWRYIPYVLFYGVPFFGFAFVVAFIWDGLCDFKGPSYVRLSWIIPLTAMFVFKVVGFPQHPVFISPYVYSVLERPELNALFNSINQSFQAQLIAITPRSLLFLAPDRIYHSQTYDLRNLASLLCFSLFTAAPAVFYWLTFEKSEVLSYEAQDEYRRLDQERQREYFDSLKTCSEEKKKLTSEIQAAADDRNKIISAYRALSERYDVLKSQLAATKPEATTPEPETTTDRPRGILDSDFL